MNMREVFGNPKVVIVGAGLAGLSAAVALYNAGIKEIAVLEAQSQVGGRAKTIKFGDGFIELGAQWLHGTKNDLGQIAEENDLISPITSFEGIGNFYYDDGKIVSSRIVNEVNDVVETSLSNLNTLSEDLLPESVGEYMTTEFNEYLSSCEDSYNIEIKKKIFDWHIRFQMIDNSCLDLWKLSSKSFGEFKFCGGKDYVNLTWGFQSVIDTLLSKLPRDSIFTGFPVKSIRWKESANEASDNICEIITENGDIFISEHVIVTCSVGFLKHNWSMFYPSLPIEYIKGFNSIGYDSINKIFLEYEHNWWGDLKGIQFIWNSEERKRELKDSPELWTCDLTGFDPIVGLRNVLVGWVGGEGAVLMENLSPEVIGKHCTELLREITGNKGIPSPINCANSSWFKNKYVMGGYSHITMDRDRHLKMLTTLLEPVETSLVDNIKHPSIVFAGEALHGSYYSTTHGAYESGQSQANKLINYIKSTS